MAKRRAESNASSEKKKRRKSTKKLLSGPESAARKSLKAPKESLFDSIHSRKKFDVIGKKRKGEERRISVSRSLAVEKRKKTLLKDYEQSRKSSTFLDKRIGEGNDELGEFDKTILRLQRERQLKLKKERKYNLSDGEEDDFDGDVFSKKDDFEEDIPYDYEGEDDETERSFKKDKFLSIKSTLDATDSIFSEGEETRHKTKKQVYEEIMAKSKFHKALKAKEKEEDERLLEQLDEEFSSMAQSEALRSLTQPNKMNALKALVNGSNAKQSAREDLSGSAGKDSMKKDKPDAYDMLVKEMALEARARPSDRTKTPEEIAQEERERLELLEEERKKRMLASEDSEDESNDDSEDRQKTSPKKLNHVSGDDLGDLVAVDEELENKGGWIDAILERKKVEDEEENVSSSGSEDSEEDAGSDDEDSKSAGDSENHLSARDWEQSDDDIDADDDERLGDSDKKVANNNDDDHAKDQEKDSRSTHKSTSSKQDTIENKSLPFVIEAPKNLVELCSLLDNRSNTEIIEAISRIRTCNAIKLSAANRRKMQVFYGVLLQYFAVVTTRRPLNIELINLLLRPLVEISVDTPYFAAICARERLMRIRTQFCEDVKDPENGSWPSLKTLMLLRLWSLTFPCSDFRHVVMTPATLLMCEYLLRCPIMSGRDVAVGSFLCSMILLVARQSHKFFPEAVIFLQVLLMSATDFKRRPQQLSQCYHFMDLKALKPWLHIREKCFDVHPVDFFMVMDTPADSPFFDSDDFRVSILSTVVELLRGYVSLYEGLISFPEVFLPISGLLHEVQKEHGVPDKLKGDMDDVSQLIKKKANEHQQLRQPLQLRKQKPVPIKLLNPKFEENYVKGRDYDPDRERVEMKKLKKLLKREAKGAARELRKDNYFLHEAKERDRLLLEEERAEKYGKARSFLQEQEHAFKSGQLGKGKGSKRRK